MKELEDCVDQFSSELGLDKSHYLFLLANSHYLDVVYAWVYGHIVNLNQFKAIILHFPAQLAYIHNNYAAANIGKLIESSVEAHDGND